MKAKVNYLCHKLFIPPKVTPISTLEWFLFSYQLLIQGYFLTFPILNFNLVTFAMQICFLI